MTNVHRHPVSRRGFLRGTGALLALPFLEQLAVAAGTGPQPPLRFGIFTVTGGTVLESWKPKEAGPLGKLSSILRPLEVVKDDLLVVSGLSHHGKAEGGLNAHEHCALLHLTGADLVKKIDGKLIASPSVDQVAARTVGDKTFLPSLEIGLSNQETKYSFRSADAPVPYEANPRLVFERMFRGRKPVVPNWANRGRTEEPKTSAKTSSIDRSVLDLIREEANDLRKNLGGGDKLRLDQYLDSVRSIEKRIDFVENRQRLEVLDLQNPGPSKLSLPTNLPAENVPIWTITQPVHRDPERHEEYIRLMADLQVLAFQTDTTRVSVFACGSDEAMFPGVVTVGYERHCHTLEHQGNSFRVEDADPIAREACRQMHAWYTRLFAEMLVKMKAIDEGGSSLLDNTMMLYTSYMADGGHGTRDYPVLLAGKAGGTLRPGRHIACQDKTPLANLYVEILDRMGAKTPRFGESHTSTYRAYDGRIPGLV